MIDYNLPTPPESPGTNVSGTPDELEPPGEETRRRLNLSGVGEPTVEKTDPSWRLKP